MHSCDTCTPYARGNQELTDEGFYTHLRAYKNAANDIYGNLKSPDTSFFNFLFNILSNKKFGIVFIIFLVQKLISLKLLTIRNLSGLLFSTINVHLS